MPPGGEIVRRQIPVLADDGVGYHMEYVTGTKSSIDDREAYERSKINDAVLKGLGAGAKGVQGQTAPSWAPKGTLGTKPDGVRKVGDSVDSNPARNSPDSNPAHKWPPD
jgi:hypothetical protein